MQMQLSLQVSIKRMRRSFRLRRIFYQVTRWPASGRQSSRDEVQPARPAALAASPAGAGLMRLQGSCAIGKCTSNALTHDPRRCGMLVHDIIVDLSSKNARRLTTAFIHRSMERAAPQSTSAPVRSGIFAIAVAWTAVQVAEFALRLWREIPGSGFLDHLPHKP